MSQNITRLFIKIIIKLIIKYQQDQKERLAYNRYGGNRNKGSYIVELIWLRLYVFTFSLIALINLAFFFIISLFQKIENGKIILSPVIILLIFNILYAPQSDSMSFFITFCIRQPIEMIILINILLFFTFKVKKNAINWFKFN